MKPSILLLSRETKVLIEIKRIEVDLKVRFTAHAKDKISRLSELGITREKVIKAVKSPEKREKGYLNREILQVSITESNVMRIVVEMSDNEILIVTVYPGNRRRYT